MAYGAFCGGDGGGVDRPACGGDDVCVCDCEPGPSGDCAGTRRDCGALWIKRGKFHLITSIQTI